jgi:competence protein ComEC
MFETPVKISDLVKYLFFSLTIILFIFFRTFVDKRTKIVFCDVGQGDAAYIRVDSLDILVDAGPDKSVLSCLGKYMPFWDKKIELAFLSHPNSDHYNGYFYIYERYKIGRFVAVESPLVTASYKRLLKVIIKNNTPILFNNKGDKIKAGNSQFIVYWPPKDFVSKNDNDFSQILLFEKNSFRLLFSGDASSFILDRLSHQFIHKVDILKIPHHGSKNGLTNNFLYLADPHVAVISVGKNNSYGHPSQVILDMLKAKNIDIRRTDTEGDIIFYL